MTFVDIDADLQILICTFLHPSDILTLRKTCKTLQFFTRRRTIWVDALRQVCLENMLFLPSFPILDMSDMELEQAAMAPRRWNKLSISFAARGLSDSEVGLSPTATRIIDNPFSSKQTRLILVPGGRYLVGFSESGLGVWDLGYTSSADCKLIASVGPDGGSLSGNVHATPDGMGLVICSLRPFQRCSFYEIYPQSETPQLTKIASLDLLPQYHLPSYCISPNKMICFDLVIARNQDTIFRVWDYRLNASVSFIALIEVNTDIEGNVEVVATQTSIIILHGGGILIWAIPPLLSQPPNLEYYSPTRFPPVIRVKFSDDLALYAPIITWRTMSSWYFDPSKPLYFDKEDIWRSQLQRFKIIIKPDFSDATLNFIETFQLATYLVDEETPSQSMFCENTLVYNWSSPNKCGIYTASTLSGPPLQEVPSINKILLAVDTMDRAQLSICPASGRLIHVDTSGRDTDKIIVYDFLPHQRH